MRIVRDRIYVHWYGILKYFALTFLASWSAFFAAIAVSTNAPLAGMLVFAGTMAPGLVALAISGKAGALLERLVQWRAGAQWYLFAVGFMAAIKLGVAIAHRMITGAWPPVGDPPVGLVLAAILFSTPFQAGEEIGWRGYALPLLAGRIGYGRGSVVLGLVWAGWHLPLFFLRVPGNDEYGQSFPVWALGVTALSVAFAWLYLHTGGSLLLMMLFHSAVNNIPHFVPSVVGDASNVFSIHASLVAWLTAGFLWVWAGFFLMRMRNQKAFTRV